MSEYNIKLDDVTIYRGMRSFNVRIISGDLTELYCDIYVELTCKNEINRALGHLCAHIG